MRVFVVGTGRCGTCTFHQACRLITNYTTSHERKMRGQGYRGSIMPERNSIMCTKFRDDHIYVDLGLYPIMATLIEYYHDARWVHLIRNRDDCVKSLLVNMNKEMVRLHKVYYWGLSLEETAEAYWLHTNNNIRRLLMGTERITLRMEDARERWDIFWGFIGAEGDFEASRDVWLKSYNSSGGRGVNNWMSLEELKRWREINAEEESQCEATTPTQEKESQGIHLPP